MRHAARLVTITAGSAGLLLSVASSGVANAAEARSAANWSAYLNGPAHSSYNKTQTRIRPGNAGKLAVRWRFRGDRPTAQGQPGTGFLASPTVVGGDV